MDTRHALGTARTPITASSAEIVHLPGGRAAITGTIGEVGQALAHLQNTGRLVSSTSPAPTGERGQVLVNVRLVPRQRRTVRQVPARRRLPRWAVTAVASGAVAAVALTGWLLWTLLRLAVENAAFLIGLLALGAVAVAVVCRVGGGRTFSGTFRGSMD